MNIDTNRRPRTLLEFTGISDPFSPLTGVESSAFGPVLEIINNRIRTLENTYVIALPEAEAAHRKQLDGLLDIRANLMTGNFTPAQAVSAVETVDGAGDAGTDWTGLIGMGVAAFAALVLIK